MKQQPTVFGLHVASRFPRTYEDLRLICYDDESIVWTAAAAKESGGSVITEDREVKVSGRTAVMRCTFIDTNADFHRATATFADMVAQYELSVRGATLKLKKGELRQLSMF